MSYKSDFARIYQTVNSHRVFSDHEHHHPDGFFHAGVDLDKLLMNSYIYWTVGADMEKILSDKAAFIDSVRHNSYFTWLEKGIQALHGADLEWRADTWDDLSARIGSAYADPDFHWKSLLRHKYATIILDSYWNPGSDDGHPELFKATFRVDKLSYGHHARAAAVECGPLFDQRPLVPWTHYGFTGTTLDDYVDMTQTLIARLYREKRIVSLKTAIAYNRSIDFYPDDRELALKAWNKAPEDILEPELLAFQNYIFHRCFEAAARDDIPVQIHTGLADLRGSDPMLIERVLAQYPTTRFIIFHSGYPWTSQAGALAHNHANAFPNLTWTPLISTAAAVRTLDEYIDIAPSINTITWGGDCWLPEESVGAQLAWRYVVAAVLCQRFRNGLLRAADVDVLAEKLMLGNGRHVYLNHGR